MAWTIQRFVVVVGWVERQRSPSNSRPDTNNKRFEAPVIRI